jgi:hypothetical protein
MKWSTSSAPCTSTATTASRADSAFVGLVLVNLFRVPGLSAELCCVPVPGTKRSDSLTLHNTAEMRARDHPRGAPAAACPSPVIIRAGVARVYMV